MPGAREIMNRLRAGNARYVAEGGHPRDYSIDRDAITSRTPIATVIACSDIKVVLEQVFDLEIGNLNVIQTAAGACIDPETFGFETTGLGEATSLIVVLGHTPCGVIDYSLANQSDPLNSIIEIVLESKARLVAAGTLPTPTTVCEEHITRTAQKLRLSLDPGFFRVEAAHLDENNGVVRFLKVDDLILN